LTLTYLNKSDLLPDNLRGVPTHPYPFYEALCEIILLGLLWLGREPLARVPGLRFLTGALGYTVIRFSLTFLRQETVIAWGLQEAQIIAVATGLLALALLAIRLKTALAGLFRHPGDGAVPSQVGQQLDLACARVHERGAAAAVDQQH
jgi:phosphatidylglycerol---prolipoprotein diacylglyceryl transferase